MSEIESRKLKNIGSNLVALLNVACQNSKLLRLIYYNTDNPYAQETVDRNGNLVQQNDITIDILMNNNIILGDVDINILKTDKTLCFLHPYRGTFPNNATSNDVFVLDVCYAYPNYLLKGLDELRPFSIGYEFFKNIDWQNNVSGMGKIFLDRYTQNKLDTTYGCVSFLFTISNMSI